MISFGQRHTKHDKSTLHKRSALKKHLNILSRSSHSHDMDGKENNKRNKNQILGLYMLLRLRGNISHALHTCSPLYPPLHLIDSSVFIYHPHWFDLFIH